SEVHVVPTTTIAVGLATMVCFDAEGEPEEVVEEMREVADALSSAEITRSVRGAKVGDRAVPQGAYMGFLDGELFAVEDTVGKTALKLAEKMLEEANVLTLLRGDGLDDEMLHEIVDSIRELDEAVEVEIRDGGQPLYPLQMVAE
ncbi:MAG: hypothetical protein M3341_07730, partial [Actinomycetota bacterium]|nr:hypothetical protein [Actinomycetota bacterium]